MNKAVYLSALSRSFGKQNVLQNINLTLPKAGLVAIVGPSGSGKSTLLNILSGIDVGYQGSAVVLGEELKGKTEDFRSAFRMQNIGYLFQRFCLLELEDVESNVLLPLDASSTANREQKRKRMANLLQIVGLSKKKKQRVNTLSGGEKQRVALARAMALDPPVLLADEPTGALDERAAHEVFSLLRGLGASRLVVVVSHDEELVRQYAERVIRLKDGRIEEDLVIEESKTVPPFPSLTPIGSRRVKPKLSRRFLFRHARHLIAAKKWRSLLSESAIALGLIGLGASLYLSFAISDEIRLAFSSLVPPNEVVLSPREEGLSPITNIYAAEPSQAHYLEATYPEYVDGVGSTLLMDFESVFCDDDCFYYSSGLGRDVLPGFSSRSINDYLWVDERPDAAWYPSRPAGMDWSSLALGLPYENMFQLCLNLHIERSYESLGEYLDAQGLTLTLSVSHIDWGFADEELFSVAAVTPTKVPTLFHSLPDWNHRVFIDQMRFRPFNEEDTPSPQDVYEVPFVEISSSPSQFLAEVRHDPNVGELVYELASDAYLPSLYYQGERCDLPRLYLYGADKHGVGFSLIEEINARHKEIQGRQPVTAGSYYASASSYLSGFSQKFFLCKTKEKAEICMDFYSRLPLSEADLPGVLPEGTVEGSLLSSSSNSLHLGSAAGELLSGRLPRYAHEAVLSSSLYEAWGRPEKIYPVAEIGSEEVGDSLDRDFALGELTVVGVKEEKRPGLYVTSDWTVDYFLDAFRMSAFLLEPSGCVFTVGGREEARQLVSCLSKEYPDYRFSCPSESIAESVEETTSYIGAVLGAFSGVAIAVSVLLFLFVMGISITENEGEAKFLFRLGVSREEITRSFLTHGDIFAASSLLSSFLALGIVEAFVSLYLQRTFGGTSAGFSFLPFLGMGVAAAILLFLVRLIFGFKMQLKDFDFD